MGPNYPGYKLRCVICSDEAPRHSEAVSLFRSCICSFSIRRRHCATHPSHRNMVILYVVTDTAAYASIAVGAPRPVQFGYNNF